MPIEQHMYTSCPPGKGYDRIDGFQTKARSPGLTDAMNSIIRNYCGRYLLPRSAQEIEYACRREGRHVPSQAVGQFPIALTYYPITDDVFALTRTCYSGRDHSGRYGIFFAHTLVFPVEALQPVDYNPLALTRTHLFQSTDLSARTTLSTLPDFQHLQVLPDCSWMSLAAQGPYAEQLVHLISAVIDSRQTGRPVILCLPRWDHAAPLIEALLMLLPPEARCRLTFTTYEHDPYRLKGLGSATSQSAQLPLQVVATLSRAEGGAFKFEHDEYQTQFAIFNFAEQQFSPPSAPSAYAQYVADCCRHSRIDRVASVQKLLTAMEVGRQPDQWDTVLPAVVMQEPFDPQPGPEAIDTPVSRHRRQKHHTDAAHTSGSQYPSGARRQSSTIAAAPYDTGDRRVAPAGGVIARHSTGAQSMAVRSPGRLAWVAGIAVCSLLGVGVILQSSLASKKLRESTTRSVSSPAVVLPHSPVWREQPILPQGTYSR